MFTLKEVFLRYTTSFQPSSPKSDLADFLISEELSRASLDQMCDLVGIKDISDIKSESMDLILHYIQTCLRDHELNDEELENIRVMKLLFRVKEGDFLSLKEEEVVQIVSTQFQMLIADYLDDTDNEAPADEVDPYTSEMRHAAALIDVWLEHYYPEDENVGQDSEPDS